MAESAALEARLRALEARIADVEAVQAIERLKARYAELVDRRFSKGRVLEADALARVAAEIAELFSEDGVWDGGPALGVSRGRAELRARMQQPTLQFSWHYFLKPRIEVRGDRASGRWGFASGCQHADWLFGQCVVTQNGVPVPGPLPGAPTLRCMVLPAARFEILDTWHTSGMRGTGSRSTTDAVT